MNLLINPKSMIQEGYTPPPIGLLYIAAMDEKTTILDNAHQSDVDVVNVLEETKPEIVGVPIYTAGRVESLRVLKLAKEHGAITVAGGPHVSVMWKQLDRYGFIDHLVVGDGEIAWRDLTQKKSMPRVIKMRVENLDELPIPAWDKINVGSYPSRGSGTHRGNDLNNLTRCSIIFGKGCDGSCSFCSTWHVNGGYRHHDIKWMEKQLVYLWNKGIRHLVWQDDCLTADKDAFIKLCDVLGKFNFSSFGTTRVDHMDDQIAMKMAEVGFYEVSFGIESGSEYILSKMNKKVNLEAAFKARASIKKAGIVFTALMIYGYPFESEETRRETNEFMFRLGPDKTGDIGYTAVLPGTVLYNQCKNAGLITDEFWLGNEPYYIYSGGLNR